MTKRLSYEEEKEKGQKIFASTVRFGIKSPELNRMTMDYNSTTGLNDTPKGIIDGIKDTLCVLDDTLAETSPFVWIPAKFYRLKKSCPELFDIDRDVTKPIDRLSPQKKKSVNQNDKVADDEIRELVNDLSKQIVKPPVKQSVDKEPTSERYVGSVASDPAVLALLYSNDQEYNKRKRSMKKQKPTPKMSSRRQTSVRKSTARKSARLSARLPGISPLSASRRSRGSSSAYVVNTPSNKNALAVTGTTAAANETKNIVKNVTIVEEEKKEEIPVKPKKKLKGIATVMDLSELSAGLKRKGSLYKDCYNEYGLEKELKNIYAINAQHWIPRTEQTEINERMALDRKLRRMIAGKDT